NAVDNILAFNPEAKFICMFRNPYELIPSWHDELSYLGHQNKPLDIAMEEAEGMNRKMLNSQEEYQTSGMMLDYINVASHGKHISRILKKVERDQVMLIKFEDFISNTSAVFDEVCDFLDL